MKFSLTSDQQQQIEHFIALFQNASGTLAETAGRVDRATNRLEETDVELGRLTDVETLDDKGIARRVVLAEKKRLLLALMPSIEEAASAQKKAVANLAYQANETFRKICYKPAEANIQQTFIDSLPEALRKDQHLARDAWIRVGGVQLGLMFNPPPIDPHNNASTIVNEAERRLSLLKALATGRDVPFQGESVAEAA